MARPAEGRTACGNSRSPKTCRWQFRIATVQRPTTLQQPRSGLRVRVSTFRRAWSPQWLSQAAELVSTDQSRIVAWQIHKCRNVAGCDRRNFFERDDARQSEDGRNQQRLESTTYRTHDGEGKPL